MSALVLDYRPSRKVEFGLVATIQHSLEGGKPLYLTRLSRHDVINALRSMDIDCELEDNVVKGTMDGKPWSFTISNE